jgi:hypothetical protein
MNKEQLLAMRALIDADIQEIDSRTPVLEGHPDVFTPDECGYFYTILQRIPDGKWDVYSGYNFNKKAENVIRTKHAAQEFAFGLEVMMKLRGCRGAKRFVAGEANWYIGLRGGRLVICSTKDDATDCILGCFNTAKNTLAALALVGEGDILRAIAGLV